MAVSYKREVKPVPHKHPNYVLVFIILAVLTAMEVAVTQIAVPFSRAYILIPLSFLKAALVALFYMHLRTDRRVFSFFFGAGAVIGIAMVISLFILINTPFGNNH